MTTYTVELTEIERACGVTLDQVAEHLPRVAVRGDRVFMPPELSPALAGAVARAALGGPVEFIRINTLGLLMYERMGVGA